MTDMRSIWTSHSEKKDNMVFPPMLHCSFNVGIPTVANSLSLSSCSMLCSAVYKKLHIWSEVTAGEELFTYSLLHAPTGSASPPPPFPPPPPSIADLTVKGSYSCSCRASTAASLFLKKYPQKTAITSFYCLLVSICCPNESGGESPWHPPPIALPRPADRVQTGLEVALAERTLTLAQVSRLASRCSSKNKHTGEEHTGELAITPPAAVATEPCFVLDLLHFIHGIMGNPAAPCSEKWSIKTEAAWFWFMSTFDVCEGSFEHAVHRFT